MYHAVILFCLVSVPAEDCQQANATHVVAAPESQPTMMGCAIYGMQFAAEANLDSDHLYAKVRCEAERS